MISQKDAERLLNELRREASITASLSASKNSPHTYGTRVKPKPTLDQIDRMTKRS